MKKKDKNAYADISTKKITAPNKLTDQPKGKKKSGNDLRIKNGG